MTKTQRDNHKAHRLRVARQRRLHREIAYVDLTFLNGLRDAFAKLKIAAAEAGRAMARLPKVPDALKTPHPSSNPVTTTCPVCHANPHKLSCPETKANRTTPVNWGTK